MGDFAMLDDGLKTQLKTYFEKITHSVALTATLDASPKSEEMRALLSDIAAQCENFTLSFDGADTRAPSFEIRRAGTDHAVTFAGLPMGHEFNSLILALLHVGGHKPNIPDATADAIRALPGDYQFETFFSLSCQNCPDVVQALNMMAALNPRIRHTAIDGALFQDEVSARHVLAVPAVFLNGAPFAQGRMDVDAILAKLDTGALERKAAALVEKKPFDVLIIGGGPAGAAAAIYTARKGLSTGIVADRVGGQVLDTMGIENFISVEHTEGPKLAADLGRHMAAYNVDVMTPFNATRLVPATQPGGLIGVEVSGGAMLQARAVVLAPGARWRQMNVPGEKDYLAKGVAFCPHCDGPLFKGKRVAVIGGGNSGVEAAIDLAGIVEHVTLIEFDHQLRADAVLQRTLNSLANVAIVKSAQTSEVKGDGTKVTGLAYTDRNNASHHDVALDGIFVQIGLVPNTEWLKGVIGLTPRGEIEVDARGATSLPGVFAAGDATTVPYKQIVIAMGEGSKAALSAFDYLIRLAPVGVDQAASAA